MLKAVIFDFDGVIADSEPIHCRAFLDVLPRYGITLTREDYYRRYLGYSDIDCVRILGEDLRRPFDTGTIGQVLEDKRLRFEELLRSQDTLMPGVPAFVNMLIRAEIRLAICSGALRSDIRLMLAGTRLAETFQVIVTAEDVARGKPDPEGFLLALRRLNEANREVIQPAEAVAIEDSFWGLQAAAAAGMKCVAVTTTYPREELAPYAQLLVERLDNLSLSDLQSLCQA